MPLSLRNPHSVIAALETRPKDVLEVVLPSKHPTDAWEKVIRLAQECRIPVKTGGGGKSKASRGSSDFESPRMGTAEALIREKMPLTAEELFKNAAGKKGGRGLWLALDSLQDPHNVGAIFRAAAFFDVQGILMTQERSVPLTATVYDVASGGLEYIPFALHTNLQRGFEIAKDSGLWILGTSEHAHDDFKSIQRDRPWLLVVGNEEKGIRRLTEESCDLMCRVSGSGKVTSLNVSVATGILIQHFA